MRHTDSRRRAKNISSTSNGGLLRTAALSAPEREILKQRRIDSGYTQRKLSAMLYLPPYAIGVMETGRSINAEFIRTAMDWAEGRNG